MPLVLIEGIAEVKRLQKATKRHLKHGSCTFTNHVWESAHRREHTPTNEVR